MSEAIVGDGYGYPVDTTASDAEMLAAVERWARARGWLVTQHAHGQVDHWLFDDRPRWEQGTGGGECRAGNARIWLPRPAENVEWRDVDPHTALLWALSVEAGVTVDVGRCPACVKRGGRDEWIYAHTTRERDWLKKHEYAWSCGAWSWVGPVKIWPMSRPCTACNGTGRDIREDARLVLDAVPPNEDPQTVAEIEARRWALMIEARKARAQSREVLCVEADRLQGTGDPLGLWLALWLADKREGTADAVAKLHPWDLADRLLAKYREAQERELERRILFGDA